MRQFRTLDEILMEHLSDPSKALSYLQVSFEEYLDDGDARFFLMGIKNVIEAQGGIQSVSERANIPLKFLSDAIYHGSMLPFRILDTIFSSFGSMPLINLPAARKSARAIVVSRSIGHVC